MYMSSVYHAVVNLYYCRIIKFYRCLGVRLMVKSRNSYFVIAKCIDDTTRINV